MWMWLKNTQQEMEFTSIRILLASDDCHMSWLFIILFVLSYTTTSWRYTWYAEEAITSRYNHRHSTAFESEVDDSEEYPIRFKKFSGQHRKWFPSKLCIEAWGAKSFEFPSLDEYMHFMSSVDCKLESERSLPMPQMLIDRRRMLLLQKNAKRRPHPHRIPCLG